jgi:hypothetical protein
MSVGYIDKDFIEEGLFKLTVWDWQMNNPESFDTVELFMTPKNGRGYTYYLGEAVQDTDPDGKVIYVFNSNTNTANRQLEDGSIETTTDDKGNELPVEYQMPADKLYMTEVAAKLDVLGKGFVAARASITLRKTYAIL